MKTAAAAMARLRSDGLRVRVHAASAARHAALERVLGEAGHVVVALAAGADIVLADGDYLSNDGVAVLSLGGVGADHAGRLAADATAEQIDAALRAIAAGLVVRSRESSAGGFAAMKDDPLRALLTPREIEILGAMGAGETNKMIARRLDISLHTVKFHVESLFRKLGVRTRAEAVARGIERQRRETIEL